MSTISIFIRYGQNRLADGFGGAFWQPSLVSSAKVSARVQGSEKIGPDLDNSVQILHASPPPLFFSENGDTLDKITHGDVYLHKDILRSYGSGDTAYRRDVGVTGINSFQHVTEYLNYYQVLTRREIYVFEMTDVMADTNYYGTLTALGKSRLDIYDIRSDGSTIYKGSIQVLWTNLNGKPTSVVEFNTTDHAPGYYGSYDPLRLYRRINGTIEEQSPQLTLQFVQTYLAVHDPTPLDMQWKLLSKIMDQLYAATNTLASFAEAIGAIKTIRKYGPAGLISESGTISKRASDLWLQYRYAYCTTKSDIETYHSAIKTLLNCPVETPLVFHAASGQYNMTVKLIRHMPSDLKGLVQRLRTAGIEIDAENLWDIIPFSFIVDWFTNLGDLFHDVDADYIYDEDLFTFQCICFSRNYKGVNELTGITSYYTREVSQTPPERIWVADDPSAKTIIKRIIDGASLLVVTGKGRKG